MLNDVVIDWFCLINSKGIGPKTFWAMMRSYKSAKESLKHTPTPYPKKEAEKVLKSLSCEIILANDGDFPKSLRRSSSCPPILFFKGDKSILSKRKIAIIGARNASINGKTIAKNLAANLSKEFAIVSGLARGIDTSAHLGSLEDINDKASIAVLPFGFSNIYPKENKYLFEKIAENGLVLTENPLGSLVEQGMFHSRNRIITLLSEAVIVVEAAAKSGTMATAKLALDFGCEVLVVPGSPIDPRNFGSNLLIKNGAILIQNYFDVLDSLGVQEIKIEPKEADTKEKSDILDKSEEILSLLSEAPVTLDELASHTNIDMRSLLCIISDLEISGKIVKCSTNEIVLTRSH
ncbi:MAG: DNA-processing protein DprA [Holosporales bacterium]|jgi:DNA processing protein|nr:DNA-processing protein DprA [Holosporales bacterium]